MKTAVLPEEVSSENNSAAASVRVTDQKFDVFLIEQEPRWDFRYLLAYLQRDRRLNVRAVMIDGEPGLEKYRGLSLPRGIARTTARRSSNRRF